MLVQPVFDALTKNVLKLDIFFYIFILCEFLDTITFHQLLIGRNIIFFSMTADNSIIFNLKSQICLETLYMSIYNQENLRNDSFNLFLQCLSYIAAQPFM